MSLVAPGIIVGILIHLQHYGSFVLRGELQPYDPVRDQPLLVLNEKWCSVIVSDTYWPTTGPTFEPTHTPTDEPTYSPVPLSGT